MRGVIIRNCPACERIRASHQARLFEEQQEPANPDDPGSPPAPPPDPYAEAKKLVTKLTGIVTNLIGSDPKLYEALVACRVVDHPQGESPRFRALTGLRKVIDLVEKGETNLQVIKDAYEIASGAFVPPMFGKRQ